MSLSTDTSRLRPQTSRPSLSTHSAHTAIYSSGVWVSLWTPEKVDCDLDVVDGSVCGCRGRALQVTGSPPPHHEAAPPAGGVFQSSRWSSTRGTRGSVLRRHARLIPGLDAAHCRWLGQLEWNGEWTPITQGRWEWILIRPRCRAVY